MSKAIQASTTDLALTVMHRDDVPSMPIAKVERIVDAAMLQLGLCCLGGNSVRLMLPNGRAMVVKLET